MKSAVRILSVFLAVLFLLSGALSVSAAEIGGTTMFPVEAADGAVTEVYFTDGTVTSYDGVADAEALESWSDIASAQSYRVLYNGEEVFTVTLRDIEAQGGVTTAASEAQVMNGYYAISFDIPDSSREVFLTGLTPRNLGVVQSKLIKSYQYGSMFDIESIEFIDTEKTTYSPEDDNLCWAAATSNILDYTGWGEAIGYTDSDEIFDLFVENFADGGGTDDEGISWFFNGIYPFNPDGIEDFSGMAMMVDDMSGGFCSDYPYDRIATTFDFDERYQVENMQVLMSALRSGCGVILGVSWMFEGQRNGGHAISAWGYVVNNEYPEDDIRHYESLIVSDSDSDEQPDPDRRCAPNKLTVMSMTTYSLSKFRYAHQGWYFYEYNAIGGVLDGFTVVLPYGSVSPEPDGSGTRDKQSSPDLSIDYISMSHLDERVYNYATDRTFYLGEAVSIIPNIVESSYLTYSGEVRVRLTVTDEAGNVRGQNEGTYETEIFPFGLFSELRPYTIEGLEAGTYTVSAEVWAQDDIQEAYYSNNTLTDTFEVSDRYDVSGLKITADFVPVYENVGEHDDSWGEIHFTYEGLDALSDEIEGYTEVYQSSLSPLDNNWGDWDLTGRFIEDYFEFSEVKGYTQAYTQDPPEMVNIDPQTGALTLRYAVGVKLKGAMQPVYLYTEPCSINMPMLRIENSNATGMVVGDEVQIEDDERFWFSLTNQPSDDSGVFNGTYQLCKSDMVLNSPMFGDDKFNYYGEAEELTIAPDETFTKYIDTYPEELLENPVGIYFYVHVSGYFENGMYFEEYVPLGSLGKTETPSSVVTSNLDTADDTDGLITFREAVLYCEQNEELGNVVTFDLEEPTIYLYERIDLDGDVSVNGLNSDGRDVTLSGLAGDGSGMLCIFGDAPKSIEHIVFDHGYTDGSVISVQEGSDVTFTDCSFKNHYVDLKGVVYAGENSRVRFNRCYAANSYAATGSFLYAGSGAQIDMLNCTIDNNRSKNGVIYNYDGVLNMVNCTVYGNGASVDGDGVIVSEGETNLLNCIVVGNGLRSRLTRIVSNQHDIAGIMNVYGSMIGVADAYPELIDSTDGMTIDDLFVLEDDPVVSQIEIGNITVPDLLTAAADGCAVTVVDGMLAYAKSGEKATVTDIPAAFAAKEYAVDMLGLSRSYACGSIEPLSTRICGDANGDGTVNIIDATLIQRHLAAISPLSAAAQQIAQTGDNELDLVDATMIQRYNVGMSAPEKIGSPVKFK